MGSSRTPRPDARGIRVVGLGPGDPGLLTLAAWRALRQAGEVYVRTRRHPTVARLPRSLDVRSFDDVYDGAARIDDVYRHIAETIVSLGQRPGGVLYAVPGDPTVAEDSVRLIRANAAAADLPIDIIPGVSFLEPTFALLGVDPVAEGVQVLDAAGLALAAYGESRDRRDPFAPRKAPFDATRPLLLCQVDHARVAAHVKLALLERYPAEHAATAVRRAGDRRLARATVVPLHQIDRARIDHLTCWYVPALAPLDDRASFEGLRHVITRLRAPGGCPWDREQTWRTLAKDLIEETFEAVEAIERDDAAALLEELGDLLLNVVLLAQISEEAGAFALEDTLRAVNEKLVRRHPHVFGDVAVAGVGDVLRNWDAIKRAEKRDDAGASRLGGIPLGLPALSFAQKVQSRAARAGFVWPTPGNLPRQLAAIEEKIAEELAELRAARVGERPDEFGDLLFVLVDYALLLGVDAESALRGANRKFVARFREMERLAASRGEDFVALDVDAKMRLWGEAKRALAGAPVGAS